MIKFFVVKVCQTLTVFVCFKTRLHLGIVRDGSTSALKMMLVTNSG